MGVHKILRDRRSAGEAFMPDGEEYAPNPLGFSKKSHKSSTKPPQKPAKTQEKEVLITPDGTIKASNTTQKVLKIHENPAENPQKTPYFEDENLSKQDREVLTQLARVQIEIQRRKLALDPTKYGLPDLMSLHGKSREEQELGILDLCKRLVIIPNGPPRPIKLIPQQVEFLTDLFFGHSRFAILWKPRGGGGSLVIGVLMWLLAVYKKKSCLDLAGGMEQARAVYNYTKGFWEGLPALKRALLEDAPMKNETLLKNGASIKCVPASERQVKSKHCPVLILDEACQKQAALDAVFMDAIQGVFSEPEPYIIMNSTFYYPQGLFQAYWDGAESRGFRRYKWTVFDVMKKCHRTDCFSGCELSWQVDVLDAAGKATGVQKWVGCCGKAKETNGFQSREAVIETKRVNEGSNVFEVQHMGQRPSWMNSIYPAKAIQECVVPKHTVDLDRCDFVVGIDWGLVGQTCVILAALDREYDDGRDIKGRVCIIESEFMTGKLTGEVVSLMHSWIDAYNAQPVVYADGSHPYNNLELERSGFSVVPIHFVKWKEYGIGNVRKYLVQKRVEIVRRHQLLISQLVRYQRTPAGKPKKREDHGPDSLLCSLLAWPFLEWFGEKAKDSVEDPDQVVLI